MPPPEVQWAIRDLARAPQEGRTSSRPGQTVGCLLGGVFRSAVLLEVLVRILEQGRIAAGATEAVLPATDDDRLRLLGHFAAEDGAGGVGGCDGLGRWRGQENKSK